MTIWVVNWSDDDIHASVTFSKPTRSKIDSLQLTTSMTQRWYACIRHLITASKIWDWYSAEFLVLAIQSLGICQIVRRLEESVQCIHFCGRKNKMWRSMWSTLPHLIYSLSGYTKHRHHLVFVEFRRLHFAEKLCLLRRSRTTSRGSPALSSKTVQYRFMTIKRWG